MAPDSQSDAHHGPPYPSRYQMLGETPSIIPDVPINAVFMILFIIGAVGHAWQYRINILRRRKFIPNAAAFAFCITRIFTTILWIVWACYPQSIECEVAALIFGYAGIILLFIINLIFSRRIVRGQHPNFGWTMLFSIPFTVLFLIVIATIICLIVAIVLLFSTEDPSALQSALAIQRYGATLYAVIAILPIFIVGISSLARQHPKIRMTKTVDKFGEGSMRTKIIIVMVTAVLLSLGACYRAETILAPRVPRTQHQATYLSKACFYIFTFTIEFSTVLFWLVMRIDRRFYVPDGAWGPHSYAGGFVFAGESGHEKSPVGPSDSQRHLAQSDSASTGKTWLSTLRSSRPSADNSARPSRPVYTITDVSTPDLSLQLPLPPKRASSRISTVTTVSHLSLASRPSLGSLQRFNQRSLRARETQMAWGGVTRDGVCDTLGESREIIPYPGFDASPDAMDDEQICAADVAVEGVQREMGWDPKTGKWALRSLDRSRSASQSRSRSRRTSELPSPVPGIASPVSGLASPAAS